MTRYRKTLIIFLFVFFVSVNTIVTGYSYWDNSNKTENETISVGTWQFGDLLIGPSFSTSLEDFMNTVLGNDPNSDFKYIYSQTDVPNNLINNITDIDVFGYTWKFWGKGKTANYPTYGYPVLIDRAMNGGTPVHDINPAYSTTPLYTDYSYFTAYDAMNTLTNNQYSLRLNYNNRMTTTTAVGQVTNISFYAMVGLADPNDGANIRDNQKIYVEVSANGSKWTKIGTPVPSQVSSSSEAFTHYSFDVPANMLGQDLYVRIRYNGRALKVSGSPAYGRLIIDELVITTQ